MRQARRALATMVFALTVGCTGPVSPVQPTAEVMQHVSFQYTSDTQPFTDLLMLDDLATDSKYSFDIQQGSLNNILEADKPVYFISHHNPTDNDLPLWSMPLAQDGIAIITHPNNPITTITRQDLQGIYRGFITNWSELGGDDRAIIFYNRESEAELQLEFNRLVMGLQQISPNAQILASNELMLEGVMQDEAAIGYIPISLLQSTVNTLAIEGVMPLIIHITDNTYPLRMTIYAIGQTAPESIYRTLLINLQTLNYDALNLNYASLPR